jgi:hypothetical protein
MDFTGAKTSTRRANEIFPWEKGKADPEHIHNLRLNLKNYVIKLSVKYNCNITLFATAFIYKRIQIHVP